jgi:hypothetical protein
VQLQQSVGQLRYHLIRRSWALSMLSIGRRAWKSTNKCPW